MIALWMVIAVAIIAFLVVFWRAGIVSVAREALLVMRNATAMLRDPELDDLARERAMKSSGISLLKLGGSLVLRSLLAFAAALVPILLSDWSNIVTFDEALAFMQRWDVILIASAVITFGYVARVRFWKR